MLTGYQSSKRICVAEHFEDDVYIMKSRGPRTEPWRTPHTQAHEEEK